jgi:hypothetical protein
MKVDEYALELQSRALGFVQEGHYSNAFGQVGYRAIYRNAIYYLWYSVSSTESAVAPDEVAAAITAPKRWIQRENLYVNRKGNVGFEATVNSGGHAFMLGAADRPPGFFGRLNSWKLFEDSQIPC